ncbi:hypothetical protein GCM10023228_33450 [Brevibacillus fulvus]
MARSWAMIALIRALLSTIKKLSSSAKYLITPIKDWDSRPLPDA